MTKMRKKFSKPQKSSRGKVKKPTNMKAKADPRAQILTKELRDFGKVGGIIDRRVGVQGVSSTTSADAALRRHIIEKLRHMEMLGTTKATDEDPLIRAAMSGKKGKPQASYDDELGGISADIVNSELFAGGLLTPVDPTAERRVAGSTDVLLDKIAATKEERLKRVEKNEEQRQKLKNADSEWSAKVRFMLSKLADLKPKSTKAAAKLEKGRNEVLGLLTKLNSVKTIAPFGAKIETEAVKSEKLLANLESIVSRKLGSDEEISTPEPKQSKTEDILLRIVCRISSYEVAIVTKLADDLRGGDPQLLTDLYGAVRGLLLTHILVEMIQIKISPPAAMIDGINKFTRSDRLNGVFIPETVHYLERLLSAPGLLRLTTPMISVDESVYSTLDVRVALRQTEIPDEDVCRLGCLHRLLELAETLFNLYSTHFPLPTVMIVFSGLSTSLKAIDWLELLPLDVRDRMSKLAASIDQLGSRPRPADIVTADKITLVLADKTSTPQALIKVGLVPQLEPQFDEKLDARRPKKKKSTSVELRQKLAKEKRGVIREMRRDAQFLANYDLQKTKANDDMRKKKTQAIIASMRSIE